MNKTLKGCAGCLGILIASILALFVGSYIYYEWIWEEWPIEKNRANYRSKSSKIYYY